MKGGSHGFDSVLPFSSRATVFSESIWMLLVRGKAVPKCRTASPACCSLPCVVAAEISTSPRFVPPACLRR